MGLKNFHGGLRKLTPIEHERLQGLPNDWTAKGIMNESEVNISDTQRYRLCGNAVTTNVFYFILISYVKNFKIFCENSTQDSIKKKI